MYSSALLTLLFILAAVSESNAQNTVIFKVVDADSGDPLPGANVIIVGSDKGAASNIEGMVEVRAVPSGSHLFRCTLIGYEPREITLRVPDETVGVVLIELEHHHEDLEEVTIYAARGSRLIDRVPTRAEVIAGEELEEKANMNSSNISMILRETPGVQVQMTDPSTANMSFKIQGLNGRYTQLLQDGLPVYGGISSSLSVVQIPPLNLKQVEIIKGSSSTLYGGGAIAGLVNLVTKTPDDDGTVLMLNALSTVGADFNAFSAGELGRTGYTMYMSGVAQSAYDVDDDGFVEVPKTNRLHVEPNVWLPLSRKTTLRTGIGYTRDQRKGGFQNRAAIPDWAGSSVYTSKIETDRFKALADLEIKASSEANIQFRNALMLTKSESNDNLNHLLKSDQTQFFSEVNSSLGNEKSDLTIGLSFQYHHTESSYLQSKLIDGASSSTVGIFGQQNLHPIDPITIEAGLRIEGISGSRAVVLPRLNVLTEWGPQLTSRIGVGTGYKHIHAMFSEVNDRIQQSNNLQAYELRLSDNKALEHSLGLTADIDYRVLIGEQLGLSLNQLVFYTRINDPFQLAPRQVLTQTSDSANPQSPVILQIERTNGYTHTRGLETNLKWTYKQLKWYQYYTLTHVEEVELGVQKPALLTPKHRLGSVVMLEEHGSYRMGFEAYFNGSQRLSTGEVVGSHVILGLMAEKTWNNLSLFVNFENFTDTRISERHPLWIGTPTHPTKNTDLYAPIDGRVINGGIKLRL